MSTALPRGLLQGSSPVGCSFLSHLCPQPLLPPLLWFAVARPGAERWSGPPAVAALCALLSHACARGHPPSHPRTVAPSAPGGHLGSHVPSLGPTASKAPPPTSPAAWPRFLRRKPLELPVQAQRQPGPRFSGPPNFPQTSRRRHCAIWAVGLRRIPTALCTAARFPSCCAPPGRFVLRRPWRWRAANVPLPRAATTASRANS